MNTTAEELAVFSLIFRTAIMITFLLLAVVGNSLTLVILCKKKSLRTKTSVFVANLAVADLLSGLLIMPVVTAASIANEWPFGDAFCQVSAFLTAQLSLTSVTTLCAVAIERYHSIVNPLTYESKMCTRNVIILVTWTWFQPFIFAILPILDWGSYVYVPYVFGCITPWGDWPAFTISLFTVCLFIPYTITVAAYYHIGRITFRHLREISKYTLTGTSTLGCERSRLLRLEIKSALVFAIVIGTYTLCWLPWQIMMICQLFSVTLPNEYLTAAAWMALLNSSCNPIIYCLMNRHFRNGLKNLFAGIVFRFKMKL
ncbi:octopamine receptor-like [Anneissia japonica]|uniref:octopamine receptor-like n=1 Tax=Anneissia japonica TaxID=1529436 RepID=UPI001425AAB7|nr:octopamine receptor-like [Anneissia japonica]